jgi:hypothetical protein
MEQHGDGHHQQKPKPFLPSHTCKGQKAQGYGNGLSQAAEQKDEIGQIDKQHDTQRGILGVPSVGVGHKYGRQNGRNDYHPLKIVGQDRNEFIQYVICHLGAESSPNLCVN